MVDELSRGEQIKEADSHSKTTPTGQRIGVRITAGTAAILTQLGISRAGA